MADFYGKRTDFWTIPERYEYKTTARVDMGERINCFACPFRSKDPGTPSHVWHRKIQNVQPAVIELCDLCDQTLSGGMPRPDART